ncbi:uncharacterized protein F5891DRAFT_956247, partial [Suillus fuscotomentosus]
LYTYTSPASCGTSTVSIFLHGDHENWDPRLPLLLGSKPDAIVGLNTGLTNSPAWQFVTLCCHTDNTLFAVTEYTEQYAELQRDAIPRSLPVPSLAYTQQEYPIAFNPFQHPGQRNLGSVRLPNVSNGLTMRVVG